MYLENYLCGKYAATGTCFSHPIELIIFFRARKKSLTSTLHAFYLVSVACWKFTNKQYFFIVARRSFLVK
jgi:hypothetical protein